MKTAEDILKESNQKIIAVSPRTTLYKALKKMVNNNIGAIAVKEKGKVIGIWTERDLSKNSLNQDFELKSALVKDYMSTNLTTVNYDEPSYKLSDKLLGLRVRHLFVVKEEQIIGLLSSGDVLRACLIERTEQLKSVSWEYYENWELGRKRYKR